MNKLNIDSTICIKVRKLVAKNMSNSHNGSVSVKFTC